MSQRCRTVASGSGWQVREIVCSAGPADPPFEERHESVFISAVTRGTFQYRCGQGSAVMVPGALVLGNQGACYECGHEHGTGDVSGRLPRRPGMGTGGRGRPRRALG